MMGLPFKSRGLAAAVVIGISGMLLWPAQAQFWDWGNRPQRQQQRDFNPFGGWFNPRWEGPREREAPVDFSHAPSPEKKKADATTPVVVMGDANADWLAYGLEDAFSEAAEIGVVRKPRAESGLIRYGGRGDTEWPQAAREIIAAEKPKFIVMMIGNNDRQPIREKTPATAKPPAPKPAPQQGQATPGPAVSPPTPAAPPPPADAELQPTEEPETPEPPAANLTPEQARQAAYGPWEFHTEKWERAYVKRIDATIAVLKSAAVPVFWVGLPSQRAPKASADSAYLNELYRSRAEKAGIVYVDIWDGFVDEAGRFSPQGPDYEGQIRRLRSGDGVYFTKFGARKLAHYVEREIQRHLSNRSLPVALPLPEDAGPQGPGAKPSTPAQRPSAGPVLPLTSAKIVPEELIGGGRSPARQSTSDPVAARVLSKGEPLPATSGRADDFSWPRGSGGSLAAQPGDAAAAASPAAPTPAAPGAGKGAKGAQGEDAGKRGATADAKSDQAAPSAEQKSSAQRRVRSNVPRPPFPIPGLFR